MATPLTPSALIAVLKAEGIVVREYTGWRDRCRCHTGSHEDGVGWAGRGWGTLNGTVTHITGGDLGGRTVPDYIRDIINGDPDVPCKAQFVIAPNGDCWLNSAGRCNHAGWVGGRVDDHMIAADFSLSDNYDDRFRGDSADGNSFTMGIEQITSSAVTSAQRATSVKINAALARKFGWTGQESVGHGEISSARSFVDPGLDMGQFRRDVMARVEAGPGTPPEPVPAPAPGLRRKPTPTSDPIVPNPAPTTTPTVTSIIVTEVSLNRADYETHHGATSRDARDAGVASVCLAKDPLWIHLQECAHSQVDDMDALFPNYTRVPEGGKGRESWYRKGQGITIIAAELDNVDHMLATDTKPFIKIVWEKQGIRSATANFHNENEGTTIQRAQLLDVMEAIRDFGKAHSSVLKNTMACGDTNRKEASADLWGWDVWKNGMLHADEEINTDRHTYNGWLESRPGRPIDVFAVRRGAHVIKAQNVLLGGEDISDHNLQYIKRELVAQ